MHRMENEPNDGRRDLDLAVQDLRERLPEPLSPLARLTFNYFWVWCPGAASLFEEIDGELWRRSGWNPRIVIESAAPRRLRQLASDRDYTERLASVSSRLDAHLQRSPTTPPSLDRPVAYFCSEYGLHGSLQLYGGGLGVLAGDTLKTASDLGTPYLGVGLFYRQGYFRQRLDLSGWQQEYWVNTDFRRLPAVLVTGPDGRPFSISLRLRRRDVCVQVWRIDIGRVPLYLLDTDCESNDPVDRWITGRLYVGDRQTRLAQYAVLGIGGVRALRALGVRPSVFHLNEGHGAFGSLERLRQGLSAGQSFDEALAAVRRDAVFTTHTPVAAGNEGYDRHELEAVLGDWLETVGPMRESLCALGRVNPYNAEEPISITPLALRTSRASNAVSRRHGRVARAMWKGLWVDRPESNVPIGHVTNGVHVATWMGLPMQQLMDRHLGPDWRARTSDPELWERVEQIPAAELWRVRCALRARLVEQVREQSVRDRLSRGESPDYVEAAARVFSDRALTVGFARRVATYKRLYLLARHPEIALRLLGDDARPLQYVIAGKAHPQDHEAKEVLRSVFQFKQASAVRQRVVFLEDYDLHIAPLIVAGVDLWINVPRPPLEASGTSGMKVVLNGGLNLSVLDGWWEEAYDGENGWGIATPEGDHAAQDEHDAYKLLDLLQHQVIPLFYDRDSDGIPHGWVERVKRSIRTLAPRFNTERMVREYVDTMYVPDQS